MDTSATRIDAPIRRVIERREGKSRLPWLAYYTTAAPLPGRKTRTDVQRLSNEWKSARLRFPVADIGDRVDKSNLATSCRAKFERLVVPAKWKISSFVIFRLKMVFSSFEAFYVFEKEMFKLSTWKRVANSLESV